MEDNKEVVSSTVTEQNANTESEKKEKTYTRAEVEAIKAAERKAIQEKYEAEKTEAEKLAKMNAEQKRDYELEQQTKRANDAESELNAYKLKETAITIAREKGLNEKLLDVLEFKYETADKLDSKIEKMATIYKQAVEEGINEKLREKSPKTVVGTTGQRREVSRASY